MFNRFGSCAITTCLIAVSSASAATFGTTGVYDENVVQANTVDSIAQANPVDEPLVIEAADYATYVTGVATAFASGNGGVVSFDDGTTITDDTVFGVTYDGGSKSLAITPDIDGVVVAVNLTAQTAISASGASGLPGHVIRGSPATAAVFTIGPITDGDAGEFVDSFGVTLLSRASRDRGLVTAVATFSDGSTATATSLVGPNAAVDDTFFGFVAPDSQSVVSVSITAANGLSLAAFDDVVFTTAVPEPASLSLFVTGAALLLMRQRTG